MRRKVWILMCVLLTTGMCRPASAQACNADPKDEAAIVQTMRTMYAAATLDDYEKLHTVVAPGFRAFDNGSRYESIDALMDEVKIYHDKGFKFVWTIIKPEVTVACDTGWITYLNEGSIQTPGASTPARQQWLESAILRKHDGAWKIVFFHSTSVPDKTSK